MITGKQLGLIFSGSPQALLADKFAPLLSVAMGGFEINTIVRAAAFIGQLMHESGEFRYMVELADGSAYEGRADLGNIRPGDGKLYKGRGPIQLSGRNNYRAAGKALSMDLESHPELVASPDVGFLVAAWFWKSRGLNEKADLLNFRAVTKAVNGAATDGPPSHHLRRLAYYTRALEVLGSNVKLDTAG